MAYNSKHGKIEEKGHSLGESISGNGVLPCGTYIVEVLSISDDVLVVKEAARGTHMEPLSEMPSWIGPKDTIEIEIGLSAGVYAKIEKGKVALFDAESQLNLTGWLSSLDELKNFKKKFSTAQPIIKSIRKREGKARLLWRRDNHVK